MLPIFISPVDGWVVGGARNLGKMPKVCGGRKEEDSQGKVGLVWLQKVYLNNC